MSIQTQNRIQPGVSEGGQFAAAHRSESALCLVPPPPGEPTEAEAAAEDFAKASRAEQKAAKQVLTLELANLAALAREYAAEQGWHAPESLTVELSNGQWHVWEMTPADGEPYDIDPDLGKHWATRINAAGVDEAYVDHPLIKHRYISLGGQEDSIDIDEALTASTKPRISGAHERFAQARKDAVLAGSHQVLTSSPP